LEFQQRYNTRFLKGLSIILPILFWLGVLFLRVQASDTPINWTVELFTLLAIALGAFLFSTWIFQIIRQREREIQERSTQLADLYEASIILTTELELGIVLERVVELACKLANAKYGALGVLDEDGKHIEQFITVGIPHEQRDKMGDFPLGHGLLGVLIKKGEAVRIPSIPQDKRAVGFPKNHPRMGALLGVPIRSKGKVIGDLYLTDKIVEEGNSSDEFSARDQRILEMFASQAAIAIENAQLYRKTRQLAILKERERFGMDLHDGIIQSIYAIGLMLDDTHHRLEEDPLVAKDGINDAIRGLNIVIRDLRNYILDLRPQRFQGRDLRQGLVELARDLRANSFLTVHLDITEGDYGALPEESTVEILHIVQEALSNVRKHARASAVDIHLQQQIDFWQLEIIDDGVGITPEQEANGQGNGLKNMRERARALHANYLIGNGENGGTQLTIKIPRALPKI